MYIRRKIAFGALVALTAGLAYAADQTILGNSLTVKNPSATDTTKRKITGKGKEKNSTNTIVGNPTVTVGGGATVTIRAGGGTPSSQTFNLPQGTSAITGKLFWTGDAVKGFKYRDAKGENSAIKSARLKKSASGTFTIRVTVTGKNGPVLVTPPNPGTNGCVLLSINNGDSYSVAFLTGDGIVTNKDTRLYKHKRVTLQNTCVLAPTTTTTTTAPSTTTTTLYGSPSQAFVDRVFGLLD